MKKVIGILVVTLISVIISCKENKEQEIMQMDSHDGHDHSKMEETASVYYCPMKCEGDKTYDKVGECPKCGMDLVVVEKE